MARKLKVLSVFGTRPEAIKMAPVVRELARCPEEIESTVCVTGQHREMLDQVLALFRIRPDHDLAVMQDGQSPTQVAASVLGKLEGVLRAVEPDWVLVQGDTTTAMAASVAAFYGRVRVGHVEAGLRTFDRHHPFPEEVNRKITGAVADLHFAPTPLSRRNLLAEGVPEQTILVTGNPVIDALHHAAALPFDRDASALRDVPRDRRLVLVTAHRRENFGRPLEEICLALREIARLFADDVHVVYPVHPNPNVRGVVERLLGGVPGISLTRPLDYLPLVHLMREATLVLTDSGGIQEEAPGFGKPVLVLRETTERPEAVDAGTVRLVGTDRERIVAEARTLLTSTEEYARMARAVNPYGDGHAAPRIVAALSA